MYKKSCLTTCVSSTLYDWQPKAVHNCSYVPDAVQVSSLPTFFMLEGFLPFLALVRSALHVVRFMFWNLQGEITWITWESDGLLESNPFLCSIPVTSSSFLPSLLVLFMPSPSFLILISCQLDRFWPPPPFSLREKVKTKYRYTLTHTCIYCTGHSSKATHVLELHNLNCVRQCVLLVSHTRL